ncbi:uncharacterized protein LOC142317986 [Lycorma delicatula]|uniref:uncharacterized protein LOC142317986 n=1 Tax=Lycorma delicatula TaxID=130591 RepID=UPI003F51502F
MVPRCDKFLIICGDIVETEFKNFYDNFLGYKIQNAAPLSEAAGELKYILKSNDNFNEVNITYSNGNPVISTNHKDKGQCNIFFVNGLVDKSTELISTFLKHDSRVQDVIVVVKKWMTLTNFISSDKLSGYAVTWMVLFYLMQDENPIIPPVIVLRTNNDANNKTFITGYVHAQNSHLCSTNNPHVYFTSPEDWNVDYNIHGNSLPNILCRYNKFSSLL